MSVDDEILVGKLHGLEDEHAEFDVLCKTYYGVCERLDSKSKKHLEAVERLNQIVTGAASGRVQQATQAVATAKRECALLMAEQARHLARLSSKSFALAEKMESFL